MIAIIDYGMGNLKSVQNALKFLGFDSIITSNPKEIKALKGMILPGVGAFKEAMDNLCSKGLDKVIKEEASNGKPLLGICLGMQMLFEKGFEVEEREGLGFLKGKIKKIEPIEKVKIPHMGWNRLEINKEDSILKDINEEKFVYYVHSFAASHYDNDDLIAYSNYGGIKIPGLVRKENVIGAQFHPEKSGEVGLKILKNFGEMVK